ncbi:MAG: calcium/sodium antiporter [Clostridia bacterium]|nr:calcium/sodium antiporter [Clostridia bacterium]MBR2152292.1 calcium/sodium antiporter [Clostridia bacterium]
MAIFLNILFLALGFIFLAKGADFFVDGASSIAKRFKIPQLVIGLTIVAMGTSMPEAAVSIKAAISGNADISIGNVVGSNILNILIILGISSVIFPLVVKKSTLKIDIPIVIGATSVLFLLGLLSKVYWWGGLIMLFGFGGYLTYLFISAKKNKEDDQTPIKDMPIWKSIIFVILGIALIIFGSEFAVETATNLAKMAGWSDAFIGLTIVALGTSLPELFTSVMAAIKKNPDIAIGNVVGSNIFNILFILSITSLIIPVNFATSFLIDTAISLACAVLLLVLSLKGGKLKRWGGIIMLVSYGGYFAYLYFTQIQV